MTSKLFKTFISLNKTLLKNMREGNVPKPFKIQIIGDGGKELSLVLYLSLIKLHNAEIIQLIIQDIADHAKFEKEIIYKEKESFS